MWSAEYAVTKQIKKHSLFVVGDGQVAGHLHGPRLTAAVGVTEVHGPHFPRRLKLQRGGEQMRRIHASNLPDRHHPTTKPLTTNSERPHTILSTL